MTALHDAGDLTCPRCGVSLTDLEGTTDAEAPPDEQLRVGVECPGCGAPLDIVIESALPEAAGVDVWVEDRRRHG